MDDKKQSPPHFFHLEVVAKLTFHISAKSKKDALKTFQAMGAQQSTKFPTPHGVAILNHMSFDDSTIVLM